MPLDAVLIVGSQREGALETAYGRAFRRLGVRTVEHFDVYDHSSFLRQNRIVNRLTQRLQYEVVGRKLFNYLQTKRIRCDHRLQGNALDSGMAQTLQSNLVISDLGKC